MKLHRNIIIAAILLLIGSFNGMLISSKIYKGNNAETRVEIIERVVTIPGTTGVRIDSIPYPVYVENGVNESLKDEIDKLRQAGVDTITIERIVDATRMRYYKEVAFDTTEDGDSLLKVIVQDSILGEKVWSSISWKVYDRDFHYTETNTITTLKPKFALFAASSIIGGQTPSAQFTIGIRTKKGWSFGVGQNTFNQTNGYIGKDIFVKY